MRFSVQEFLPLPTHSAAYLINTAEVSCSPLHPLFFISALLHLGALPSSPLHRISIPRVTKNASQGAGSFSRFDYLSMVLGGEKEKENQLSCYQGGGDSSNTNWFSKCSMGGKEKLSLTRNWTPIINYLEKIKHVYYPITVWVSRSRLPATISNRVVVQQYKL